MEQLVATTTQQIVNTVQNIIFSVFPIVFSFEGALIGLAICISLLVSWWGISDNSFMIGGFYMKSVPYKGYHRFRSQKWNSEHS